MGMIKDKNSKNLTEIKKRWQKYTEEQYKKGLNDWDNQGGMVMHQEPDILECKVKWALWNITMNKANRGDGIAAEIFKILKDDAVKVLHSICHKFGKLSSVHRAGKGQFSFQSQRRTMPKNVQATIQLCSFHTLARSYLKSFKLGFSSVWTKNFQIHKLGLEKAEKPKVKLPTFIAS